MKDQVLQLKNVCKDYILADKSKFTALTDVNLSFKAGELVSVVGESGSGKSTLMNLIGGLDRSFEGQINVEGQSVSNLTDKQIDNYRKHKVGFVFQQFNLIPHLSVLDNVTIAMTLSGAKGKHKVEQATKILTSLGLKDHIKKRPNQLSGGQKQRVAIARALINEPEIILADEPTGALDSGTTVQILKILKQIADSGKLVVMVTHSEKVAKISSRIIEMADGKIVSDKQNTKYKKEDALTAPAEFNRGTRQTLSLGQAFRLAFYNMRAHKLKNFLMAFGFAIGIMSVILMLAFSNGMDAYINQTAGENVKAKAIEYNMPTPEGEPFNPINMFLSTTPFEQENIDELSSIDKVEKVVKSVTVPSMTNPFSVSFENTEDPANPYVFKPFVMTTYHEEVNVQNVSFGQTPKEGVNEIFLSIEDNKAKELGFESAEQMVGQTVTVSVMLEGVNLTDTFTVCGVNTAGGMETVLISYQTLEILAEKFNTPATPISLVPTTLYLVAETEADVDAIKAAVSNLATQYRGSSSEAMASMFNEINDVINIGLLAIIGISLLVSLIMILVVLYISVSQRTKEIGVLKSIGARRADIKNIFVSESLLIGLYSGLVGITAATVLGIALNIIISSAFGASLVLFTWWHFALAMAIGVGISMVAGLYPASRASKLDPIDAIRQE